MRDALKNYLTLASGLTEVGRQRAVAASKALVAQGEATAEQVSSLADDLIQTSKNNRELVTALVRSEVEKALSTVGLATADSVERLTKRLQTLEAALRDASQPDDAPAAPAGDAAADVVPDGVAAKTAAKRAAAKTAPAKTAGTRTEKTVPSAPAKPTKAAKAEQAERAEQGAARAAKQPAKKPAKKAAKKKAGS